MIDFNGRLVGMQVIYPVISEDHEDYPELRQEYEKIAIKNPMWIFFGGHIRVNGTEYQVCGEYV